jgi:filamentous hemagglutinin
MLPVVGLFKTWHWVVGCLSFHKLSTTSSSKPSWQHRPSHSSLLAPCRKHQKHIAQILLASYFSMPGVLLAQGATAANTAHAPSFDTAANGVPIVNINAPSAQGVSRNEYDQLNVDAQGLIFNNSTSIVQTQLAGHVDGNKHLGGKSASIILNEVMGNRRSALNGYMEIAGQRAQLIIANQHGITCNGCGFINTSRGMLTTGASVFDAFGNLSGFDVSRGDVDITGLGFNDTDTDEVDILARSVSLNANMWANQATIITGDNLINYNDKSVTSRSIGEKTGFSLDVAAIGGMYANRIRLIGTEKGLGVNLSGKVSGTESMMLDTQGNLVNKVSLSSKQLSVNANNITNTGELLGDNIALTANDLENTGSKANIQASNALNITLQGTLNNQDSAKIQTPNGQLTLNANLINNQSTLAANQLTLIATQLDNHTENGSIFGTDKVDLTLTGTLNNRDSALIQSDKQLVIRADGNITNRNATLGSVGSATIKGQNLINTGKVLAQNDRLTFNIDQQLDNQGRIQGNGITLTANQLMNSTVDGKIYSTNTLNATINGVMTDAITNKEGALLHADKALTLTSYNSDIINTEATIESATSATLTSRNLTNSGTILALDNRLTIRTQQLENQGMLGGENIDVEASVLNNTASTSQVYANNDANVRITAGAMTNSNGALIHAGNTLTLSASGGLTNTDSIIESAVDASLTSQDLTNSANGILLAQNGSLTVNTGALNNDGTLTGKNIEVVATVVNNIKATSKIESTKDLTLTTQGNVNNINGAKISANDTLTINAKQDLINTGSHIESTNNIVISSRNVTNTGNALLRANDSVTLDWTGSLTNQNAVIAAANNIKTSQTPDESPNPRSGSLTNDRLGMITAQNGTLDLTLGGLTNYGSMGANRVKLDTNGVSNMGSNALIMANEHLDVRSTSDMNNYDGGSLFSMGSGYLQANGTLTNSSADIETRGGNLTIYTNHLVNKISTIEVSYRNEDNGQHTESFGSAFTSQNDKYFELEALIAKINYYDEDDPVGDRDTEGMKRRTEQAKKDYPLDIFYEKFITYIQTTFVPFVSKKSAQGQILSSKNIDITGDIDNEASIISAMGDLNYNGKLNTPGFITQQVTTKSGTEYVRKSKDGVCTHVTSADREGAGDRCEGWATEYYYELSGNYSDTQSTPATLINSTFTGNNRITGKGGSFNNVGTSDTVESLAAKEAGLSPEDFDAERIESRRNDIFNDLFNSLVNSALFRGVSPNPNFLVETNPLLTSYKSFISSDYLLNKLTSDSVGRNGKVAVRLGDGFLEQRLVRDQILSFTGFQTLPDSVDIESTYATLMNNAVDSYQELGLSTGIALSAAQIAQLQQPIVWMVTETVDTPSGPQQALVPKVYFSAASGLQLRPDGALVAANSIDIETEGDINNTGSMLAKVNLSLKGRNISNSGTVSSLGSADLASSQDIKNTRTINAVGDLNITAGGNLINETLTDTRQITLAGYSESETIVGDTASIQGGSVSLAAGNDIRFIGSEVGATENLTVAAGNDVTMEALAINKSQSVQYGNNRLSTASTTHQVSTLSGNNIQLSAGNTLTSEGAQVNAKGNLGLSATNIDLLAVTDSKDDYSFIGGGGNSTEKRTHNETLTGTALNAGGTLSLVSQQDIFSKGSTLSGGEGIALAAGGDVILATAVANNASFEEVKKKKSGTFGSKKSTKTTTTQSTTNQGTNLASGGDINITSGANILLSGTKATANGNIDLDAKGDIQLLSAVDQTSSRYQEQKKGSFKVKAKDQGSIKQTAVTSELFANGTSGQGNIALKSGNNINLEGATLAANDTLSMGAGSETQQAVTKDANGHYVNAEGTLAGNVTVGTQALQSSEWNESSSGYRGILKDVARSVSVVASNMGMDGEIKVGESRATRTETLKQQTSTLAANDLTIDAQNDVALIGANVSITDTASINAQNVTIDAAQERTVISESHTDHTISSEGATLEKDQISLVSLTETKHTEKTTTTANTWAGSNISTGNLNINAKQNVAIIASDIKVQNNADITGENILVGGREATTDTTHDSITETKTLTVGVKNAYVDVVLAIQTLKDAKKAIGAAKDAYNEAKQKVAEGKLPKSDLDFYKVNLAAATANVASATTAVTSAGATAAASTATYGFTINGGVATQTDTTSTTRTQGTWNGSNINVGGNTSLTSNNNLNVEGSNIDTVGQLVLNAKNINITAGTNTDKESTESRSEGASTNVSISFTEGFKSIASVAGSGSVNGSKSNSDSQSTQYVNSGLNAGSIVSNSDNLTIEGGNLNATGIDITTGNLVVTSLQDTGQSSSKSSGGSVGFGSSNNVGINASQSNADSAWVNQQSGITGGTVNITAKDTALTGAVIAAVDDKGNSTDKLTFTTDTLTVADLQDSDNSKSMGIDLSLSKNTTKVGGSFNGHEKDQTTKATVGLGNVTVGGLSIEESIDQQPEFANLNREAGNSQEITKDMERGGVDISLTVDNRMLTEKGRKAIANDFEDTYEHGEDIGRAAKTINNEEDLNLLNFGEALAHNAKGTQLKNDLLRNPDNAAILAGLKSDNPDVHDKAMQDLGHLAQEKFGLTLSEINLYDGKATTSSSLADTQLTDVKGGVVVDANSSEAGKLFLDVNGESKTGQLDNFGHEILETQAYQGKGQGLVFTNSEDQQEALGDAFGKQLANRINQAAGGDLDSTGGADFNQRQLASNSIAQGTYNANKVGNAEVDHRQLYAKEVAAIKNVSKQYAEDNGISQNSAEKALGDNLRYYIDKDFQTKAKADGFVPDNAALNYLAGSLNGEDYISNPSDLPVVDSNYSKEETLAGLKNYGETSSTAFNDRTIGAKPLVGDVTWLTGDDKEVRDFYDKHNPRDASVIPQLGGEALGVAHSVNEAIGNAAQGVINLLTTPPIENSKQISEGLIGTLSSLKHPEEMFAESNKGNREAELDRRDIFGTNAFDAGYHQGQSDVKAIATAVEIAGALVVPELNTVHIGKLPERTDIIKPKENHSELKADPKGGNGSFYAEGDFKGDNPADSIVKENNLGSNYKKLMSQIPEKSEVTKNYTQDNRLVDEKLYNNHLIGEKIDLQKPEEKGKKGAITETIRRLIEEINDEG